MVRWNVDRQIGGCVDDAMEGYVKGLMQYGCMIDVGISGVIDGEMDGLLDGGMGYRNR